jgi:hypothetical protein
MRETRVEWKEFTWLLITYVCFEWFLICTHRDTPPIRSRNWGLLVNSPAKKLSFQLKVVRNWGFT